MDTHIYLDASGQSTTTRLWGALFIVGTHHNNLLQNIIKEFCDKCENFQELKGKWLEVEEMKKIIERVNSKVNHHYYCKRYSENNKKNLDNFLCSLKKFSASKNTISFYTNLKKVNQIKLFCIIQTTLNTLSSLKNSHEKFQELNVYIDNENLPSPKDSRKAIQECLQILLTKSKNSRFKNIYIQESCDSEKIYGIQYVDILLCYIRETLSNQQNILIDL